MVKKPWRIATLVLSLVLALSLAAAARATASISKDSPDPLLVTPANPTELDTIHFTISGIATSFCPPLFSPPVLRGTDIVLYGVNPAFPVNPSCQGAWTRELSIPPLPPGTYRVEVVIDPNLYATQTLVVTRATPPPAILTVDPRLPTTSDPITLSATVATNCPTAFGIPLLL
ncbi:MAG TPA: hypothetical protein VGR07_09430, partial [Thermoanaerobaculia bacterium]|nr:hypothetical protein [Thermoanaerobaculia bacterium]